MIVTRCTGIIETKHQNYVVVCDHHFHHGQTQTNTFKK